MCYAWPYHPERNLWVYPGRIHLVVWPPARRPLPSLMGTVVCSWGTGRGGVVGVGRWENKVKEAKESPTKKEKGQRSPNKKKKKTKRKRWLNATKILLCRPTREAVSSGTGPKLGPGPGLHHISHAGHWEYRGDMAIGLHRVSSR